jgi:hypothetical protein
MILNLSSHWIQKLVELPETGMGYQRMRVSLRNGRELRNVIVENAQHMSLPDELGKISESDIASINIG